MTEKSTRTDQKVRLDIKVLPGASKSELAGIKEGRLRIRIAAQPTGGKANEELIAYLAGILHCPKKSILIELGEKSRQKTLILRYEDFKKLTSLIKEMEKT